MPKIGRHHNQNYTHHLRPERIQPQYVDAKGGGRNIRYQSYQEYKLKPYKIKHPLSPHLEDHAAKEKLVENIWLKASDNRYRS